MQTVGSVWYDLLNATLPATTVHALRRRPATDLLAPPTNRALLVGINEYPDPAARLEGCVNDAFLVARCCKRGGIEAENIRLLLDERATSNGIKERLGWLLQDVRARDTCVFYFSGHGAQLPRYGIGDRVDGKDETLVPYDFDWSEERALTDDWFLTLYPWRVVHHDLRLLPLRRSEPRNTREDPGLTPPTTCATGRYGGTGTDRCG